MSCQEENSADSDQRHDKLQLPWMHVANAPSVRELTKSQRHKQYSRCLAMTRERSRSNRNKKIKNAAHFPDRNLESNRKKLLDYVQKALICTL